MALYIRKQEIVDIASSEVGLKLIYNWIISNIQESAKIEHITDYGILFKLRCCKYDTSVSPMKFIGYLNEYSVTIGIYKDYIMVNPINNMSTGVNLTHELTYYIECELIKDVRNSKLEILI